MTANELRLENLVQWGGIVAPVIAIRSENMIEIHCNELQFWEVDLNNDDNFNYIQITKEWLIKFGFKEVDNRSIMRTFTYDGDKVITMSNGFYMVGVLPEIKYVHQLQNAYRSIYGKELIL